MGERRSRAELEALAFGEGVEAAERAAALRALGYGAASAAGARGAAAADAAGVPGAAGARGAGAESAATDEPARGAATPTDGAGPLGAGAEGEPAVPAPGASRRRGLRRTAAVAGAVVLLAGAVYGGYSWAQGSAARNLSDSTASATDPAQTSRLAAGDPAVSSSFPPDDTLNSPVAVDGTQPTFGTAGGSIATDTSTATALADTLFGDPRTSADRYPFPASSDDLYMPGSTHLVLTGRAGIRIFIARARGADGGYCLLVAQPVDGGGGAFQGSTTCAVPGDFASRGLSLSINGYTVGWSGNSIAVTPTGQ